MNKEKAQEILEEYIQSNGGLFCLSHYLSWAPGDKEIILDCEFDADELEAIVWWMRNSVNIREDDCDKEGTLINSAQLAEKLRDERKKMHKQISQYIKTGDLGGNGCDKNAERNGLVLAANIIFSFGI